MSKELWLLLDTVLYTKGGMNWTSMQTTREHWTVNLETQKGVSFLVTCQFWVNICTIWAWKWLYFPIFVMLHHCWHLSWHHCDLDTLATAPQCSRHPQEGAVQKSGKSDWWFPSYSHFCILPLFCWSDHIRHDLRTDPTTADHPIFPGSSWHHC